MIFCKRPAVKKYMALLHWFIPVHLQQSQVDLAHAQNIVAAAHIAAISVPLYAWLFHRLEFDQGSLAVLLGGLAMLSSPAALKMTGNLSLARELFVSSLYALLVWLTYLLGGSFAPTLPWLLICSMVAMLTGGKWPGIAWGGISSITVLLICNVQRFGVQFPSVPVKDLHLLQEAMVCGLQVITVVFLLFFEIANSQAFSKLEKALRIIQELAIRDELTGIYNRRHILKVLEEEKQQADLNNHRFCVCLMDIDHFKRINDQYGHAAGDQVLQVVVQAVQKVIRITDYFGRYGGEEFVLMLPNTDAMGASVLIERIRQQVEQMELSCIKGSVRLTASFGLSDYHPQEKIAQTVARADAALYRAKATGRNRIVSFDSAATV